MPFIMWNNLRTIEKEITDKPVIKEKELPICIVCKKEPATFGGVSQPDKYWFARQSHKYCWTCFKNRQI